MTHDLSKPLLDFLIERFVFDPEFHIAEDASLLENGIIDSTGVLELVAFLEERFGIAVEDDEIVPENMDSLQGICAYVQRKQAA